jgi:hypothetical protein
MTIFAITLKITNDLSVAKTFITYTSAIFAFLSYALIRAIDKSSINELFIGASLSFYPIILSINELGGIINFVLVVSFLCLSFFGAKHSHIDRIKLASTSPGFFVLYLVYGVLLFVGFQLLPQIPWLLKPLG